MRTRKLDRLAVVDEHGETVLVNITDSLILEAINNDGTIRVDGERCTFATLHLDNQTGDDVSRHVRTEDLHRWLKENA